MSFAALPPQMLGYATYELSEKLAALSTNQRAAINRIVQHVYIDNLPLSDLLFGDEKICSETNYYRRGAFDEDTGRWAKRPGWAHDEEFQSALNEARRLALGTRQREEVRALEDSFRRSKISSPGIIDEMVSIATGVARFEGVERPRDVADKDKIQAAKTVLDFALKAPDTPTAAGDSDEADWWKAAEDE